MVIRSEVRTGFRPNQLPVLQTTRSRSVSSASELHHGVALLGWQTIIVVHKCVYVCNYICAYLSRSPGVGAPEDSNGVLPVLFFQLLVLSLDPPENKRSQLPAVAEMHFAQKFISGPGISTLVKPNQGKFLLHRLSSILHLTISSKSCHFIVKANNNFSRVKVYSLKTKNANKRGV